MKGRRQKQAAMDIASIAATAHASLKANAFAVGDTNIWARSSPSVNEATPINNMTGKGIFIS
jgi:hypothetical protein